MHLFVYELVAYGTTPTWREDAITVFRNPIHVGDKLKMPNGGDMVRVVDVEHYSNVSVLYVFPTKDRAEPGEA